MEQSIIMSETQKLSAEMKARRVVRIEIAGGATLEGSLMVPKTRSIAETLNSKYAFLEFETMTGDKIYISKPTIQTVQLLDYPKPRLSRKIA